MKRLWFVSLPLLLVGWDLSALDSYNDPMSQNQTIEQYRCGLKEGCECWAHQCSGTVIDLDLNFLYWRAENHGFSFALSEQSDFLYQGQPDLDFRQDPDIGKTMHVKPKWEPGFRVGLGWNTDYDRWNCRFEWTWYHNHASETRKVSTPITSSDGFYPLWPVSYQAHENNMSNTPFLYGIHSAVHASWQLWYNTLDLALSRSYYVTQRLALAPLVSVRAAQLNQHFLDRFAGSYHVADTESPDRAIFNETQADFHGKNNWKGIGPRFGMSGFWDLSGGFSFLGKAAVSLLYGPTKVHSYTYILPHGEDTGFLGREITEHFNALIPNLEMFLGFSWSTSFSCEQIYFGVDVGWELNYWENQFNIPVQLAGVKGPSGSDPAIGMGVPLPTVGNQPVTLEGLTINVHLDF